MDLKKEINKKEEKNEENENDYIFQDNDVPYHASIKTKS